MFDLLASILARAVMQNAFAPGVTPAMRVNRNLPLETNPLPADSLSKLTAGYVLRWQVGDQYHTAVQQPTGTWVLDNAIAEMAFEELDHEGMAEFLRRLDKGVVVEIIKPASEFMTVSEVFEAICEANGIGDDEDDEDDDNCDETGRLLIDLKPANAQFNDVLRILKNCGPGTAVSWVGGPSGYTVERRDAIHWKLVGRTDEECRDWYYFRNNFVQDLGSGLFGDCGVINNGQLAKIIMRPDVKRANLAFPQ